MNLKTKKIAICIPAYNEELTIAATITEFHSALPEAEIWIIDNNSSDSTQEIANSTLRSLSSKGGILFERAQGKGNAVRRAFLEIDADIYVLTDADLTYPASRIYDLIAPLEDGLADMTVGDRISRGYYNAENKRPFHGIGNTLVRFLVNKLFGANLNDIMSGYRGFTREFVKNYPILVNGFEIETDMTIHALDKKFRIVEISVEYRDRPAGSSSKLNTFSDGAKVLFMIAQIFRYFRPLQFFLMLSFLFFIFGFIAAIPVFNDWIKYRFIHHVPLAILAASLEIIAALLLAIGLILDSLSYNNRALFEARLLKGNKIFNR